MAKKGDKKLYSKLRNQGVRKKTARIASQTADKLDGKGRVPKALSTAIGDLRGALDQLDGRVEAHERKAAGRKAARTRQRRAQKRSDAARKAARKRAKV
jgi:outer membrane murein-binding lipoprotein Lpp